MLDEKVYGWRIGRRSFSLLWVRSILVGDTSVDFLAMTAKLKVNYFTETTQSPNLQMGIPN